MTIKVTQEHINKGKRGSCRDCPIALAIKEQVGHDIVRVFGYRIKIGSNFYTTPSPAFDFLAHFDVRERLTPGPFEFTLGNPLTFDD